MKVKFVDLARQNRILKAELMSAIEKIVDEATFNMGAPLEKFEHEFADFCRRKYCIGLNSGTDALLLPLIAYGIKAGDEVIVPPNSYFSTAMVISLTGAKPVFVDITMDSYNIDPTKIEQAITNQTKAIIPVHLYGQAADMDPIMEVAKKHNLIIIEDCAQAHGTQYKEKQVPYGNTGGFSFYPGKNLGAFGDAGAVVTDNDNIRHQIELLRNDGSITKYRHERLGYKSRLDTLQATILSVKLTHLDEFVKKRRVAAQKYNEALQGISQVTTPKEMKYGKHAYHIYSILATQRDELQKHLESKQISTVVHYPIPIHLQEAYKDLGYKKGDFPNAEYLAENELSLPIFPEITDEETEYICSTIKEFYKF